MSNAPDKPITPAQAWQPFTPRGVAAFAYARFSRVFLVQLTLALLVFAVILWAATTRYGPVIRQAARSMPEGALLKDGVLVSAAAGPQTLAANPSLEIILDLHRAGGKGGAADLTLVLAESNAVICGFAGCAPLRYPAGKMVTLTESAVDAWWGAWRKTIVVGAGVATIAGLFVFWWAAAFVAAPVVRLIGFFNDRAITIAGSWRLCATAMLPGSLILCLGAALHAFGAIDLLRLGLFAALYALCSLFFIFSCPVFLRKMQALPGNPFATAESGQPARTKEPENPFRQ